MHSLIVAYVPIELNSWAFKEDLLATSSSSPNGPKHSHRRSDFVRPQYRLRERSWGQQLPGRTGGGAPKTPALPSWGARGSPSGSWEGWGGQLWSSRMVGWLGDATKPEQGYRSAHRNFTHRHTKKKVHTSLASYSSSAARIHTHTHSSLAPRQRRQSAALFTPTPPSHHVLRPHIWCTICVTPPNVTGSPSPSLEGAEGERGTRKVILGVNVIWTSLDASGQSRHAAEQCRVVISWKRIAR